MKKIFSVFAVLVFVLSLYACGSSGGGGGGPTTGTLRLHNSSGVTIDYAYLSPASSATWGANQLSSPLSTGYYYDIVNVPPNTYDAKATVVGVLSTYYGYLYSFQITAGNTYNLYALSSSFTGSIKVVNVTAGAYITGLYISPASSGSWGVNQLSSSIAPSGSLQITDLPAGSYDVKAVWDVGPDSFAWSQSISSLTLLTLNAS